MQEFESKVAVVTGGASGIGLALAQRFAAEGAKVVLADVQQEALERAVEKLRKEGADAIGVTCDVSDFASVRALRDASLEAFGRINILCNNAGVQLSGPSWTTSLDDWKWIMGVNLYGVIHGIHVFVPQMIEQGDECHIINTASMSGLLSVPMMSAYQVTKHGVVTLTESLSQELARHAPNIKVSVLCPAFVRTKIHEAERNRPEHLGERTEMSESLRSRLETSTKSLVEGGMAPEEIADAVVAAMRSGQLHILTHPKLMRAFRQRAESILASAEEPNDAPQG